MTPLKTAIIIICIFAIPFKASGQPVPSPDSMPPPSYPENSLGQYRQQLTFFREQFRSVEMPDCRFFLFGMGNRTKLIYKKGCLIHAFSGETICQWPFENDAIIPNEYSVEIQTPEDLVMIYENEVGVLVRERGKDRLVPGTNSVVILPGFTEHRYSEILKVLHHEILINVVDSKPMPNFMVYQNPWRRDAAMMAMCLSYTGNLELIKGWVLGLTDPYDRNNGGETEADNLGQTLYLLSLFTHRYMIDSVK